MNPAIWSMNIDTKVKSAIRQLIIHSYCHKYVCAKNPLEQAEQRQGFCEGFGGCLNKAIKAPIFHVKY